MLDVLGPDLKVLFVGINPSLRSAEVGHNFARPGPKSPAVVFHSVTAMLIVRLGVRR